ncbi:Ca2 :Cation Antiporter (CaCA) Family [Achlya hypogyna]|uniref:Ca2:Cation Antiporter (CaCA) Family n=1 Tax=Achlya hypogyna TaxID=1202772 RepID=A0A1V9ZSY0_ACHHY|nr:Ca2 :Cation Antiporter (CaCA) Family [Achlya hypogyna]
MFKRTASKYLKSQSDESLSTSKAKAAFDAHRGRKAHPHNAHALEARVRHLEKLLQAKSADVEAGYGAVGISMTENVAIAAETIPLVHSPSQRRGGPKPPMLHAFWHLLTASYVNVLLLVAPFAIWAYVAEWGDIPVFVLNFLTMMPLANILGESTEALAYHAGDTIGGLVNATFGNAVEVIIAIFALKSGEVALVQSSLIGSMLSNMLLVLGSCFMAGHFGGAKESSFSGQGASINMSLLFVSSFTMLVPSYYQYTKNTTYQHGNTTVAASEDERAVSILGLSHISALFLIGMYVLLMVYQLVTHRAEDEDNSEEEEPELSLTGSVVALLVATVTVSIFSEFLVSSVDGFTETANIPKSFVGIILLPIVGNAVEHVTAVKVALKNNMELAMSVAIGSATQISLFVVPVCVVAGWIMGTPMSLAFNAFEAITYVIGTIIVYVIVADGKSNWLEGAMLIILYCLIGVALLEIDIN